MSPGADPGPPGERRLLAALRRGDEDAFRGLLDRLGPAMTRAALVVCRDRALAEDVVQEAWLHVVRGLPAFEGRSSLRTWVLAILGNCARRRAAREGRTLPFAAAFPDHGEEAGFMPADHPRWARMWAVPVDAWGGLPEDRLLGREVLARLRAVIDGLPPGLREVIVLRDVEGWSGPEAAAVLGISEDNQRARLHRARTRVRREVGRYLSAEEAPQ